ncbi:MAG: rRNA maturation RNase YbeY [Epsilonproteobacteria bacterium]|nr:rRNA maturation RNase YbeY [Campylobacterota bacterium]
MLLLQNDLNFSLDTILLENILISLSDKDVELLIIDNDEMQELNLTQRNINKSTDVLSFPLVECDFTPLGSIVINKDIATSVANELGHNATQEIALLFIHGLLHLLGYDHEKDNAEMREKEKELIKKFDLPKSLIIRSES